MKPILLCVLLYTTMITYSQDSKKGKIVTAKFLAPSIQGNRGGEDPARKISVYLPPGYNESKQHYPVIYFLHAFLLDDSLMMAYTQLDILMNAAIANGHIRPMILVLPNCVTHYKGSFNTNSTLIGRWADYIGKDVVEYVDKNYRTIPTKVNRGIAGVSMGGNGALKMGMLFPEVFGAVYALSPAVLNWSNDFNLNSPGFRITDTAKSEESVFKILKERETPETIKDFYALVFTNLARAYSPNEKKAPFSGNFPVSYISDSLVVNTSVLKQWEANFPVNMIENHLSALKSLSALKIDWGRNDEFTHIPFTCLQFSKKLESFGVNHIAEEYLGTHHDKLGGLNGRLSTEMLPFFNTYLSFQEASLPSSK